MNQMMLEQQPNHNDYDSITERLSVVNDLVNSLEKNVRYWYDSIPGRCWKTAENQAKAIKVRKSKIAEYKKEAVEHGVIKLEISDNGRRSRRDCSRSNRPELHQGCNPPVYCTYNNFKHCVQKWEPYYTLMLSSLTDSSCLVDDDVVDYTEVNELDWNLFRSLSPDDLNRMPKVERVQFYQTVGFLVLPTNYIVNKISGDEKPICSCFRGPHCKSPGKHPVHGYKFLTPANYHKVAGRYLDEFRDNPRLNEGAKLYGYSLLDADERHGGLQTFQQLQLQSDTIGEKMLDESVRIKSPGGFHIIVKNEGIGNHADFFGPGVDVRSERGFHVLPGSIHKSGIAYEWESTGNPGILPASWFTEISEPGATKAKATFAGERPSHPNHKAKLRSIVLPKSLTPDYVIPVGYREPTLFKFAARERGLGKGENEIFEILQTIRDTFCEQVESAPDNSDLRRLAQHVVEKYDPNNTTMYGSGAKQC